jgi:hypothetical protein
MGAFWILDFYIRDAQLVCSKVTVGDIRDIKTSKIFVEYVMEI